MMMLLNYCGKNKYKDEESIGSVLKYIAKEGDTNKAPYTYGVMCSGNYEQAAIDFDRTQELYNKEPATKVRHFAISPKGTYSVDVLKEWMVQLGDLFDAQCLGNEYQIYFGIHTGGRSPHIHFALNPISCENGKGLYFDEDIIANMMTIISDLTNQEVGYKVKYETYPKDC
ncbi:MAG: relaxase/mobilization nuclease domain-containing protein [Lachnospiraceae bacterium]|nr:relaxase/mobilization nuclease domain-containing protein [Lachnospiraceae bacterium]